MNEDKDARILELWLEVNRLHEESNRLHLVAVTAGDKLRHETRKYDEHLAGLERKLAERDEEHDSLVNMLNMEVERLTNKLAEQQAAIKHAFAISPVDNIPRPDGTGVMVVYSVLAEQFERGYEELNNLLAKAKEEGRREAVPEGFNIDPHPEVAGVNDLRCPTCKTVYGHYIAVGECDEFFANELHIWDLLDEVEGYRRGVAITHLPGKDPVEYFRDRWHGLIPREFIAASMKRILAAAPKPQGETK